MRNAFFPHMEWAKGQLERPGSLPLGWSGAPHPPGPEFEEHGREERLLVRRIARRYGVPARKVYLLGGTSLANFVVIAALTDPGDLVAVETPRYASLAEIPRALGCRVVDVARVPLGRIPRRARLLILTSPHNPTGKVLTADEWRRARDFAEGGGLVLVDEVYRDLQKRPGPVAAARHRRFVTTASLTKSYGLGALRLGWALAAPDLLARIRRVDNLISVAVSNPSILAANRHWPRLGSYRRTALRNVAANLRTLRASGLEFIEPDAGLTAFVRVGDGDRVSRALARRRIAVVPGSFFGDRSSVRIFLGADPAPFRAGIEALR